MHKVQYQGASGEIRWGYLEAFGLGSWHLVTSASGGTLTATVQHVDAFRASQQPLTFLVPRPHGSWRWPILSLQFSGTQLTATVGPPKE